MEVSQSCDNKPTDFGAKVKQQTDKIKKSSEFTQLLRQPTKAARRADVLRKPINSWKYAEANVVSRAT